MPNVNFTSSSIAQQDRFAQTTVSYESRNMQSIPFYPDVDHKAKFRGIFALTFICSIVVGALFGLLFGFRDVLFQAVASSPIAELVEGGEEETSAVPEAIDEKIDFSLAANEVDTSNPWYYLHLFDEKSSYSFVYDGTNKSIPRWNDKNLYVQTGTPLPEEYDVVFKIGKTGESATTARVITNESDWPKDVGTYTIWIYAVDKSGKEVLNPLHDGKRFITITKANIINFPGISLDAIGDTYTGSEMTLDVVDSSELEALGVKNNVKFRIQHKAFGSDTYSTVDKVCDAGYYKVTLEITGNSNVNGKTFTSDYETFTIAKANVPTAELEAAKEALPDILDAEYDGEVKELQIYEDKLPDLIKNIYQNAISREYIYTGIDVDATGNEAKNAGTYNVSLHISHKNYNDIVIKAKLVILKADLKDYFTFNNASIKYTGKALTEHDNVLNISKKANFPDYVTAKYYYEAIKGMNTETGITPANIVKVGTYRIVAKFSYNDVNAPQNFILPEDGTVVRTLEIKKGDIVLSNVSIKPFTATYTGNRITLPQSNVTVTGIPAGENIVINVSQAYATDAGTHEVTVTLSGANYNSTSKTATIVIEKAPFGSLLNLKYTEKQTIQKTGKGILPQHSEIKFAGGYKPEDLKIDYLVNGKSVTEQGGVDKLGNYKIDLIVSDKNHESKYSFDLTIVFNPMSIVFGLVLGVIAGILISVLIWLSYLKIEEASYKSFKGVRLRLLHERGGDRGAIVCEGRVTIVNWNSENEHRDFPWIVEPRWGRLFLTHATLEYYDSSCSGGNFKTYKNYRNFLIQLKEVTGVEIRGAFLRNKLIVFARGGRHVFYVEPNTAYLWRRDIMHFRDLAHLYPMENNVVDNNYPFNYTLVEQKNIDPNVPRNV